MSLQDKKIILAITGSIAAYKAPQLVRLLVKSGAEVQVIMTASARDFVTPLALSTVSRKEVYDSVSNGGQWNNHVKLGRWADVLLVAPCSANSLAKMAQGLCDNMVQAVYLSAICPVVIAPAMDEDMWQHPATRANVAILQSYGHSLIPVTHGELASGIIGAGRMAEPADIVAYLDDFLVAKDIGGKERSMNNKKALITAGPTYEAIDPVRFIGNYSTGKMGIALANAFAAKGISVNLVLGPVKETVNHPLIKVHNVTTAREMFDLCLQLFPGTEYSIMAAAVADYRPSAVATDKIKKDKEENFQLNLIKNPDILSQLGKIKEAEQLLIGFALETENEQENAKKKLESKNADMIVLNSLNDEGAGFGHDTNKVSLLMKNGAIKQLPLQSKTEIAKSIVDCIMDLKQSNA